MKYILGIDTSCYTTSVAIVDTERNVICDQRKLLEVKLGGQGLRQSEAVFRHIRNLPELLSETGSVLQNISAVAVSQSPRDVDGSYMPVFQAGLSVAKAIATSHGIPLITTNHQSGHVAAGMWSSGMEAEEFLALHLSGGTLEILKVAPEGSEIVAATSDISAGQFIDRIGVAMGMKFPAGPELERVAQSYDGEEIAIATSVKGNRCSLSGPESRARQMLTEYSSEAVAYSVFMCVVRTIQKLIVNASEETGLNRVLLVGGVASSTLFCDKLTKRMKARSKNIKLFFCAPGYASDNAVGVAMIGTKYFME